MLNRPHQKLRIHKQIDALYKWKNNIDFIPPFVEISPISYCNQECKFCYTTHLMQKLEKMPTEVFLKLVRNLGESGVKGLRLQGIGEPTLHPDLGKAINVAGEFNLETALTTNGVLMREKLLNECLKILLKNNCFDGIVPTGSINDNKVYEFCRQNKMNVVFLDKNIRGFCRH